jgi:DCN1-like protein 1/2
MGGGAGRVGKTRKSAAPRSLGAGISRDMRRNSAGQRSREAREVATALFEKFKDPDQDKIGPESLERFMEAIELDPLDIKALIFAWKLNARTPCEFSRTEFVDGLIGLGVDSISKLKRKVPGLNDLIADPEAFRSFYVYSFDYNKPAGQRSMPVEYARQLWALLLSDRFAHMDLWLDFLEGRTQAITRDTYVLFLDFATTIVPDMSNFDEIGGAWPVLLDEFVEFAKPKLRPPTGDFNDSMEP